MAQVLKNWYTLPYHFDISPQTFVTTHECFSPASVVLKPNVQLISYEEHQVKFIELDPDSDALNVRKNPSLLMVQTFHTQRVIFLPRRVYDDMLGRVSKDTETKVVWLFHSARCGSTLWAQIFYALPKWTVFSESQTVFCSAVHARTDKDFMAFTKTKMYEKIVVSYIRSFLLLVPQGNSVFWRAHGGLTEHMIPIINKNFPKHKILFAYRSALPSAKSYHRVMNLPYHIWRLRLPGVQHDILNQAPTGFSRVMRLVWTMGYDMKLCHKAISESGIKPIVFEWYLLMWAVKMTMIKAHKKSGIALRCVKYETLVAYPKSTISSVFDHLDISQNHVKVAMKVMELDSQAGLPFSQKNRLTHRSWVRSEQAVRRCNMLLKAFDLPDIDNDYLIGGTL